MSPTVYTDDSVRRNALGALLGLYAPHPRSPRGGDPIVVKNAGGVLLDEEYTAGTWWSNTGSEPLLFIARLSFRRGELL